jgi:CBS domain-containing protein
VLNGPVRKGFPRDVIDLIAGSWPAPVKEPAMSRTDIPLNPPLDGMLRHLGAAYYDSLHGRIAPTELVRALDCVAEHIHEPPAGLLAETRAATGHPHSSRPEHHDLWHSRVRDVMTTGVMTVAPAATYKQIAILLAEREISGVPVLAEDGHVAGVVSDADLVAARDGGPGRPLQRPARRQLRLTAGQLMSAPAVTIQPDATISAAGRLMSARRVRRLPVVDGSGRLAGIVTLRDLLSLFVRSDGEIAWQVTEMLAQILPADLAAIQVSVHDGIVTLATVPGRPARPDMLALAVRLTWDIDGVVDVVSGSDR